MQVTIAGFLALLAAPMALSTPIKHELVKRQAVNFGKILSDHNKFVSDPATAKVPIPDGENDPVREAHRVGHASIGPAGAVIPKVPGLGGGDAKAGGSAGGGDAKAGGSADGGSAGSGSADAGGSETTSANQ